MRYLELHNVEYGERVVLGGSHGEILMVDCGSMNRNRKEDGSCLLYTSGTHTRSIPAGARYPRAIATALMAWLAAPAPTA